MTIETKGDFSNEDKMKRLHAGLLEKLNKDIERENTKARVRLFGILLEMTAVGYAWYHFGWHMAVVLLILYWAIIIKVKYSSV